jgi:hypothetical protein
MEQNYMTSPRIESRSHLAPQPHVVAVTHETGTVLLDCVKARYYTLNETGAVVWSALCDAEPTSRVVQHLADAYQMSVDVVLRDVDQLIDRLRAADLIVDSQ